MLYWIIGLGILVLAGLVVAARLSLRAPAMDTVWNWVSWPRREGSRHPRRAAFLLGMVGVYVVAVLILQPSLPAALGFSGCVVIVLWGIQRFCRGYILGQGIERVTQALGVWTTITVLAIVSLLLLNRYWPGWSEDAREQWQILREKVWPARAELVIAGPPEAAKGPHPEPETAAPADRKPQEKPKPAEVAKIPTTAPRPIETTGSWPGPWRVTILGTSTGRWLPSGIWVCEGRVYAHSASAPSPSLELGLRVGRTIYGPWNIGPDLDDPRTARFFPTGSGELVYRIRGPREALFTVVECARPADVLIDQVEMKQWKQGSSAIDQRL